VNTAIVLLLIVLSAGVASYFAIKFQREFARRRDRVYEEIAARWSGKSISGGYFGRPVMRFTVAGVSAKLDTYSTGGEHPKVYTQLQFGWLDGQLRCEVYPEKYLHRVGKMLGMTDIQIGSDDFDPRYIINGNSDETIRQLLSFEVQHAIDALRGFLGNDDINVSVRGGQLLIRKLSEIGNVPTLDRFVRLGIRLYEAASNTNAEGIDFVAGDKSEGSLSLNSAVCQVCGDGVAVDAVFCRSCKTPHHQDCWEYYGRCSTYGCGQEKYLVLKKASQTRRLAVKQQP